MSPHAFASVPVGQEGVDRAREFSRRVGTYVDRGVAREATRLDQVGGDHRLAERQVLDDLDHRRQIVEPSLRIRRQTYVSCRDETPDGVARQVTREFDAPIEPERRRKLLSREEHVSPTGENRLPIAPTLREAAESPYSEIDTVLWTHDADPDDEMILPPLQRKVGIGGRDRLEIRIVRLHDEPRRPAAALGRDLSVAIVH